MCDAIKVAIVSGLFSLAGIIFTGFITARKSENNMKIGQAITDTKIDELTREVREHNNYAKRVPVLEEQMKVANHRIGDLEELTREHEEEHKHDQYN